MKIAGMFGNSETAAVLNRFLKKFDIEVAEILGNVKEAGSHSDIEAVIVHADARPKEQHKRLMYNIRAIMPEILLVWLCKEQERDKQFEDWAFSAVNLKNIIYINENGEIPVNRLIDALTAEHERLIKLEEDKKAEKPDNISNINKLLKEKQKPKVVEKVVEKKIIVEKKVIIDRPTVVKGLLKIAAFSVTPGAGSTSMSVKLAQQLSGNGRTAVIETGKSNTLDYAKPVSNCEYRALKNLEDLNEALHELYKSGFNIVITDYGCLFDISTEGILNNQNPVNRSLLREFIQADVKIGMAFTAPWQIGKLKFFCDGNPEFEGLCGKAQQEMCFLTDGEPEKAEKLSGIKCFDREVDLNLLMQLLVPDIAVQKQKKQRGIFGNIFLKHRSLVCQNADLKTD